MAGLCSPGSPAGRHRHRKGKFQILSAYHHDADRERRDFSDRMAFTPLDRFVSPSQQARTGRRDGALRCSLSLMFPQPARITPLFAYEPEPNGRFILYR